MGGYSAYNNVLIIYTDVEYIGKDICKRNQADLMELQTGGTYGSTATIHIWMMAVSTFESAIKFSFLDFDKIFQVFKSFFRI